MTSPTTADVAAVVSAVANVGGFAFVGLGLLLAWRQLDEWKHAKIAERRAIVAEEIIDIVDDLTRECLKCLDPNRITDFTSYQSAGSHITHATLMRDAMASQRNRLDVLSRLIVRQRAIMPNVEAESGVRGFLDIYNNILSYLIADINYINGGTRGAQPFWREGSPTYYLHLMGHPPEIHKLQKFRDLIEGSLVGYIRYE